MRSLISYRRGVVRGLDNLDLKVTEQHKQNTRYSNRDLGFSNWSRLVLLPGARFRVFAEMSAQKKRNFQIEAFKHRVVVDPKYAEKTWTILEHAIKEIYNHNASGLSFEELYRFATLAFASKLKFMLT